MPRMQGKVKALPVCVAASVQHSSPHGPGEGVGTGRHHQGPTTQGVVPAGVCHSQGTANSRQKYVPMNKENLPCPLALDCPVSKPGF